MAQLPPLRPRVDASNERCAYLPQLQDSALGSTKETRLVAALAEADRSHHRKAGPRGLEPRGPVFVCAPTTTGRRSRLWNSRV